MKYELSDYKDLHFAPGRTISKLTGLSADTLKKYRKQHLLIEGIHWVRLNSKSIRYCIPLVLDWMHNQADRAAHERAIESYQSKLLSNQPKPRRSNSKKANKEQGDND